MSVQMSRFRKAFKFAKENANWFPGHMAKGVKDMQRTLKTVDCIIEVHDARIPFSGRNPNFYHLLTAARPHILVLNKKDLTDMRHQERVKKLLRERMNDTHVVYTNCRDEGCRGVEKIVPMAIDLIKSSERLLRPELHLFLMIIGIPNVGKSSLINSLRNFHLKKGNAAMVGAVPGITRSVMNKIKVSETPLMYLYDTPGILQPNIVRPEIGMKLALCATIQETVIEVINKADYLLFWSNKNENFGYVEFLGLKEPTDDIYKVLIHVANSLKMVKRIKSFEGPLVERPDLDAAAHHVLRSFQKGNLGKFLLDFDLIAKMEVQNFEGNS